MVFNPFKVCALLVAATVLACSGYMPRDASPEPSEPRGAGSAVVNSQAMSNVVVLELFTSQGCSSCPPADHLLTKLANEPELRGRIIPLAFHVDYWNYIGWADPFSSSAWTERQGAYNRALGHDGLYTPQLVINGRSHVVGSDEGGATREIVEALAVDPKARIVIAPPRLDANKLSVKATLESVNLGESRNLKLYGALFQNGLVTPVKRGENSGRSLQNDFVVRRFVEIAKVRDQNDATRDVAFEFDLEASWQREKLGIAVFFQDPATMRIHAAAARTVH